MSVIAAQPDCTAEVVRSFAELNGLTAEWAALFARQPSPSPALHLDWIRAWWDTYGPAYSRVDRGLRLIAVRRGGRLVGALPLYARTGIPFGPRRLGFVSTGEHGNEETCPEYLDLLRLLGEEDACLTALAALLSRPGFGWDEIDLVDVPADSPLCGLRRYCPPRVAVSVTPRGECPIADLSGGFDAYLTRLSSSSRQQFRRLLKAATGAGLVFEVARCAHEGEKFFDELVALHQDRWTAVGKAGCFASPRFTAFHRRLTRDWVPSRRAVLARLQHNGTPLALIYGFVVGPKFHFYQSGIRTADGPVRYPGFVAHLRLMEWLAQRDVELYDFLQGAASYKERFTTKARPLVRVRLTKPGLRTYCGDALKAGWRQSRRWLQPN